MRTPPIAEITLTWARGLLEESVEHTGALSLVLTALCRQLARPLPRGSGVRVSATFELEPDTSSLRLRGASDALREAARLLPSLFTRPLTVEGARPRPSSDPLWREDLLARTGGSALALQGLDALGPGARDEARRLLRDLDPWRGTVNCLLRTEDETLRDMLGIAAPVRREQERTGWADGTPRWRPGAAPGAVVVASGAGAPLCSVMVPRTPDGSTVGELLRSILADALLASGHGRTTLSLESQGMGERMRVVLSAMPPLPPEPRAQALAELLRQMPLLPDSWIESVRTRTDSAPRLERGRRVRGMDPAPPSSFDGVRRALEDAQASIHLALDPTLLDFAAHRRLAELPVHGPAHEDPAHPVRTFTLSRDGRRSGGTAPSTRVRLTRTTLAVEDGTDHRGAPEIVGLDRLVAVLEDETGARRLLDDSGSTVTVRTADLDEGEQLESYLAHTLSRVPHLRSEDLGPRVHPLIARRSRRRSLVRFGIGSVVAAFVFAGVLSVLDPHEEPEPEDAWKRETLAWDETVELSNGTRITASQPLLEQDVHRVTVTFCGGADTQGPGFDGEEPDEMVQNIVRPGDFTMYTPSDAALLEAESPQGLPSEWLDDGECVTGELRFDSMGSEEVDLVYRNSLGDSITWQDR